MSIVFLSYLPISTDGCFTKNTSPHFFFCSDYPVLKVRLPLTTNHLLKITDVIFGSWMVFNLVRIIPDWLHISALSSLV